jgi:hypothetical protein
MALANNSQAGELGVGLRASNELINDGRGYGERWGLDRGPLSARNSSKGALVAEAHAVFRALASGMALDEVRSACLTGRLLRQSAGRQPVKSGHEQCVAGRHRLQRAPQLPPLCLRPACRLAIDPGVLGVERLPIRADAGVSDNCHAPYVGTAHHFRKYLSHTITD